MPDPVRPVTAGDLLAFFKTLSPDLIVDAVPMSWRFVHPDGRLQHLVVQRNGRVEAQAEPADPSVVPYGPYCYGAVAMAKTADGTSCLRTAPCPHWHLLEGQNAFCDLLGHDDWSCMWDQIKVCGLNGPDDHDFEGNPDRMWEAASRAGTADESNDGDPS